MEWGGAALGTGMWFEFNSKEKNFFIEKRSLSFRVDTLFGRISMSTADRKSQKLSLLSNKSTASGAKYVRSSVIFPHRMAFVRGRFMQ